MGFFSLRTSLLLLLATLLLSSTAGKKTEKLDDLVYREYPRRTEEEAAVLEWGHSAVIRYVVSL
jgi:hypothetical protein